MKNTTHRVYGVDEHLAQKVLVVGVHRLRHSVKEGETIR